MKKSQERELRESGLFRAKAMERFLNGMEPDAPVLLKAWPWKALGTAIFFGASAFLLWFWA